MNAARERDLMKRQGERRNLTRGTWLWVGLLVLGIWLFGASNAFAGAPPSMSIDDPVNSQTINSVPYTVSGTCSGGSGSYTSITFDDGSGAVPVTSGPVSSWTHSWNPTDGTYTLNASCTDTAAKTGTATAVTGVVVNTCVDGDIATMTISDPIESADISGVYTVYGQVGVESAPLTMGTVEFNLNGAGWTAATGNNGSDSFTISWDTTLETDGIGKTIQVRGFDPDCGGTNLITSAVRTVSITNACSDTDLAVLSIADPADAATIGGVYRVKLGVATESDPGGSLTSVEFSFDGGGYVAAHGWDGSNWYFDWDTSGITGPQAATIDARATDTDCSTLVNAPQRSITVDNSGPGTTLNTCSDCHTYPPTDGTRDLATGYVIGDHDKHSAYTCTVCHANVPADTTSAYFAHRNRMIEIASGTIGVSDNGTYNRGASFAQSQNPTTGTCSLVDCHGNTVTPQWGVGTTACDTCHDLPPSTNNFAHNAHYSAKGWTTGVETQCVVCHPNNAGGHTDVTDNSIQVNALGLGGSGAATTCNSTGVGCHNGGTSPAWNVSPGTITCTDCHTVGGSNTATVANPVSGLHGNSVVSVRDHDATLGATGCEECHVKASITGHWDETASATADYTKAQVGITSAMYTDAGGTGATRGSCLSNTDLASCHSDGGEWRRMWSTDADVDIVASPLPGQAVCNVCHGQYSTLSNSTGWNEGTVHYRSSDLGDKTTENKGITHTDVGDECEDCHGYDSAATHNSNNAIDFSDLGGSYTITYTDRWYCSTCHDSHNTQDPLSTSSRTFLDSLAFPSSVAHVTGTSVPEGGCSTCHGGGTTGDEDSFWPDNGSTTVDNGGTANNDEGAHVLHMTVIARRLYNENLTQLLANNGNGDSAVKQKAICEYCHAAVTNDGDHMTGDDAEVFSTSLGQKANHLSGAADANATYSAGTCSSVDCHNSKSTNTTYDWYSGATATCTMCHTVGSGDNPTSGLHSSSAPTTTGVKHDDTLAGGCTGCHGNMPDLTTTQTVNHVNGGFTGDTVGDLGFTITYNQDAANQGRCANTCHNGPGDNGTWERKWNSAINNASNGSECAGCHGGLAGTWNAGVLDHTQDFDGATAGEIQNNHGADDDTLATMDTKCSICHVYNDTVNTTYTDSTTNIGWVGNGANPSTYHGNDTIDFNSFRSYTTAGGLCGSSCHVNNTNHDMADSGWGNPGSISGAPDLACTDCHGGGSPSAGVSSTSPHVAATTGGGFAGCEACHNGHADGTTGTNDIEIATTLGTFDDKYSGHAGGKIQLGGTATSSYSPTSEAEYCWGCHEAQNPDISEWDGSSASYDYGSVTANDLNWLTTSWSSAIFSYKDGKLTNKPNHTNQVTGTANGGSTHGVMGGSAGVDAVGSIGCSACHDVHDTGGAPNTASGPFLRGSWTSNPFLEDGAPGRAGSVTTWADNITHKRGNVPRAGASLGDTANNEYGGWQTEDNNSYTRTGNTNHGALCIVCHTSLGSSWKHGVVVDGLSGGTAANIFDISHRGTNGGADENTYRYARPQHIGITTSTTYQGMNAGSKPSYVGGLRDGNDVGDGLTPNAGKPETTGLGSHIAVLSSGSAEADFHRFTCSKCHNPHASRLPRLLITNCLDARVNTWDDGSNPSGWGRAGHKYSSTELAYAPTAGNCHRYVGTSDGREETGQKTGTTTGSGWNTVSPWGN